MTEMASAADSRKPKRGLIVTAAAAVVLAGGGVAGGLYFGRGAQTTEKVEDPRRPKLVLRTSEPVRASATESGSESEKSPRRVGTVAVESDQTAVNPKEYEIAYYPIGQSFTANLADGSGFVQAGLSASTYFDSRVADNLVRQSVAIRSAILLVLSDQHAAVLATPEGKQALQRQLAKSVNQVLREREGFGGIDNVYFTSLVVQ